MGKDTKGSGFFSRNRPVFIMGLTALVIAATADLIAGLFLSSMETYLLLIPGMMILVYSAIGMRGNIFGAMGSRLGTSMHMGTFGISFGKGEVLRSNIESSIALTFLISLAMGAIGWVFVGFFGFGDIRVVDFVFISMMGGLLAGLVLLIFNILIAKEGFKRDWDVDNITAPLIAAAGDIVTMPMLFFSAWLVLNSADTYTIDLLTIALIALTIAVLIVIFARKAINGHVDEAKRIIKQSTPILLLCLLLDIFAGVIIETETESLVLLPVLLILMPAFLNEGNALSGMLTSRLSSMLHLGTLKAEKIPGKNAGENFLVTYTLALVTYAYIGVIAYIAAVLMGGPGDIDFLSVMAIVLISGMIATTVLNFISYYVAIAAVRFDLDPDDHSIPVTSSSMDLVSAMILIGVILLII